MSIWKRLIENAALPFQVLAKNSKSKAIAHLDPVIDTDFAAAVVALAAKMAKADGVATLDETLAFRAAFPIAKEDEEAFERLFALAKTSVLGYEGYAKQIGKKYKSQKQILVDVLAILFLVAAADGAITKSEENYLADVAVHMGIKGSEYSRISMQYFPDREPSPYLILGIDEAASDQELKSAWLKIVNSMHPDNFIARGEPIEFVKLANQHTALANDAYRQIKAMRTQSKNEKI
ncbi:MAG: DnaJ like chaperone protein [Hyphomonadaceae bacterium]|nr:MAG: DnaJ like chaperone protein [Hyphomonadaceae bacterium]